MTVISSALPWASVQPAVVVAAARARRRRWRRRSGPSRQGRPKVSVTTHGDAYARGARAAGAQIRRALASGSSGSSTTVPARCCEASTPAAAMTSPCRVSTMRVAPRRATTRTVSAVDGVLAVARRPRAALGLADHLAGHDHDVAVAEPAPSGQARSASAAATQGGEVVAGAHLGQPRQDVRRARERGCVGLVTDSVGSEGEGGGGHRGGRGRVGHQQRHGAGGDPGARELVDAAGVAGGHRSSHQPAVEHPAARCGRRSAGRPPPAADLDADRGQQASAMPRTGRRRRWARRRRPAPRACRTASRTPGTPRIVPTDTTGLRRRQDHHVGVGDRVDHAGPGRRRRRRRRARSSRGRDRGAQCVPTTPGSGSRAGVPGASPSTTHVGLDPVVGHRQQPDARLPARAQRLGHRRQRVAGVEHLGAHQVGGECRGRRARTTSARTPYAASSSLTRQSRPRGPSRAPRRCRRRGCTSRCRGRGRSAGRAARCRRRCCRRR